QECIILHEEVPDFYRRDEDSMQKTDDTRVKLVVWVFCVSAKGAGLISNSQYPFLVLFNSSTRREEGESMQKMICMQRVWLESELIFTHERHNAIASMVKNAFFKKKGSWNPEVPGTIRNTCIDGVHVLVGVLPRIRSSSSSSSSSSSEGGEYRLVLCCCYIYIIYSLIDACQTAKGTLCARVTLRLHLHYVLDDFSRWVQGRHQLVIYELLLRALLFATWLARISPIIAMCIGAHASLALSICIVEKRSVRDSIKQPQTSIIIRRSDNEVYWHTPMCDALYRLQQQSRLSTQVYPLIVSADTRFARKRTGPSPIAGESLCSSHLSGMSGIQQESLERSMPAPNSPPLKPELATTANLFNDPNLASLANQMLSQHYFNQTLMSIPNLNAALGNPLLFQQYQRYHQAIAALTIPAAMPSPPVPMQQPTSPVSPALSSASASSALAIHNNNNNNNSNINNNDNSISNNNNNNNSNINNNNEIVSSSCADKLRKAKPKKRAAKVAKVEVAAANGTEVAVAEIKAPGKDRNFTCQVCFRSFGYKHVLQITSEHTPARSPSSASSVTKGAFTPFTRDHHLKTHMRLHTGEKPYHCTHCDRQFVQVANLRRHLRVHTGERPYACELCKAKFSDSNQLKSHMLIHKDEKPFKCDHCETNFRRKHHLDVHKCKALASARATPGSRVAALSPPLAAFSASSASSSSSACSGRLSRVGSLSPCSLDLEDEAMLQEKPPLMQGHHQQPATYLRPNQLASSIMQDVPFSTASVNLTSAAPVNLAFQTPMQTEPEDLSIRGTGRSSDETSIRPDSRGSSSSPFSFVQRDEDVKMEDKTDLSAR
ncbi:unnamed protein product, partial [Trichogramma brassicae]